MAQQRFRAHNRLAVLRRLLAHGPVSRTRIAAETGLTAAAISRIVRELIAAGIVVEGETHGPADRPGRRFVRLAFSSDGLYVVGLGFEAYSQGLTVANLRGEPVAGRRLRLGSLRDPEAALDAVAGEVASLLAEAGIQAGQVLGLGVAIVGIVDREAGQVLRAAPLGWSGVPVAALLRARLGLPVVVENLLHANNQAELDFGITRGCGTVLLVRTSLSVGASALVAGGPVRGARFSAGQIAHVPVAGAAGRCLCGAIGCLDTVASGRAVLAAATGRPFESLSLADVRAHGRALETLLDAPGPGGAPVAAALDAAGRSLGAALTPIVAALDPDRMVLAGPVGRHPGYVAGVRAGLARHRPEAAGDGPPLLVSRMEARAAAVRLALTGFLLTRDLDIARLLDRAADAAIPIPAHPADVTNGGVSP